MSVVVEAIEGVVDFAGKVVEGILDDPLTAIATAAAFSMGIPFLGLKAGALAAGVANTAAGLVQGEDFDEAIKGGVMAGVGSWAGQQVAGAFGSTADDAAGALNKSSSYTQVADDAALARSASTGGSNATYYGAQASDDVLAAAADDTFTAAADDALTAAGDDALSESLKVRGANVGDSMKVPSQDFLRNSYADASGYAGKNLGSGTMTDYAGSNAVGNAAGEVVEGVGTVTKPIADFSKYGPVPSSVPSMNVDILKSDILTKGTNLAGGLGDDVASAAAGNAGGYNIIDAAGKELAGYWDDVAGYGGKAIDWAKAHPIATTAGVVGTGALVSSLGDKGDNDEESQKEKEMREAREEANRRFEEPLPSYQLKRNVYTPFSEQELVNYGEDPYGEGQFFSKSVYEPYYGYSAYADGGAVMPQQMQQMPQQPKAPSRVNPAFAFYRYGNVPESVRRYEGGGYAHGGSRGDGRSDHIEALLSPGEFVMDAETVSMLGNGSSEAGARRLEEMRQAVRKQKGGALSKGKFSPDAKSPLAYLSKKR